MQRNQVQILDIPSASFDIYEYRAEKLGPKLESYLAQGNIAAIVYSNPNNPAWICLTEDELRTIGELATRYDAIVIEDLAYLCMDFRKPLGRPFEAPYQATVARYTDNYILMISGSKIFSYAGQRIAIAAISDKLYPRHYPALKQRYGMGRLGDAYVLTFLYAASSGTSHSAQHALAAMFRAAADGQLDFVGETSEYARRARLTKEIFRRHGFRIVYDKDQDETVSDGFFLHRRLRRTLQRGAAERTAPLRHLRHIAHIDRQPPAGHPGLRFATELPRAVRTARNTPNRLRAKPPISLCDSRQPPKP